MNILLTIILLFSVITPSIAAPPVVFEDAKEEYPLGLHLDLLEDKDGRFALMDVMSAELDDKFVASAQNVPFFHGIKSTYWARFRIVVQPADQRNWFIWIHRWMSSTLYIPTINADYIVKQTDTLALFAEREIKHPDFILVIPNDFDHTKYIYMRVKPSYWGDIQLEARLWSEKDFYQKYIDYSIIQGIYYGFIIVMMFYNLFIYFSVRDNSYLYYVAYISLWGLSIFSNEGLGFQYLWPDMPQWNLYSQISIVYLAVFFLILFLQSFLKTKTHIPRLHQACNVLALICLAAIPIGCEFLEVNTLLVGWSGIAFITVFLLVLLTRINQGSRAAKFFAIAFSFWLVGCAWFILFLLGILPTGFFTQYGMQIGSALEIVLLSLALADRINTMNQRLATQTLVLEKSAIELENQNQELEKLDRLKDEFLANTSHELKTPLNGIIGLSDALLLGVAGTLPAKANRNLALVKSSGQRLHGLVVDILDMSKLKSGKVKLHLEIVDLHIIAETVLEITKTTTANSKLSLINDIAHDTMVYSDRNRLEQILYNLIGNAVKFTENGFVRLHALIQGERIRVLIEDTGIGIAMAKQKEIFNEFIQADGSTERKYGGTGLGLSVVKQLVELHDGTVTVTSELGKGSIFSFDLRMADAALKQDRPESDDMHGSTSIAMAWMPKSDDVHGSTNIAMAWMPKSDDVHGSTNIAMAWMPKSDDVHGSTNIAMAWMPKSDDVHGSTNIAMAGMPKSNKTSINAKTILIIDDEALNREVLENYLEIHNYKSLIAKDGIEGLNILNGNRPDLIMLDIMMPQMSGYDFCRKVRETYSETELPIIMVTAKSKEEDLTLGFMVGANDYVTKPYNRDILFARVSAHLTISKQYTLVKQADLAKSEFFKIMSHELRTPLNAMIGYTEMVCEDLSDDGMDEYVNDLKNVLTAGNNLLTMVSAVLDLNKIAAGDEKIAITEFHIQPIMNTLYQLFAPLLEKTKNKLLIDIAQNNTRVICTDRQKLILILSNLVDNGCKFTHGGDIRISVNFTESGTQFIIADTGIGIHADIIEKIFEPFVQADTSITRKYGGTGIGLALVKANTDLLQGNIDVTSREGDGSKFTLFVPNIK